MSTMSLMSVGCILKRDKEVVADCVDSDLASPKPPAHTRYRMMQASKLRYIRRCCQTKIEDVELRARLHMS